MQQLNDPMEVHSDQTSFMFMYHENEGINVQYRVADNTDQFFYLVNAITTAATNPRRKTLENIFCHRDQSKIRMYRNGFRTILCKEQ
jgi:hypothetical protein